MVGPQSLDKIRVLVIDDERVIADTLTIIFKQAGYEAGTVYSAEQALELMPAWPAHVAVIDVRLPGMNGVDLAIRLKAEYPQCKIVLFSGNAATTDLLEKARVSGHDFDCLAKPVPPKDFLMLLADLFNDGGEQTVA
jgi:DNA-binding NtrC family response regulator